MSRLQFRAWDENFGKMLFAEEFEIYYEEDNGFHSGGYADNGDWYNRPIMQATGLKDKDGADIYEGDLVLVDDDYEQATYEVVWDDDGFWGLASGMDAPLCDFKASPHLKISGHIYASNVTGEPHGN